MKSLTLKLLFLTTVIAFVDYLIMIVVGCAGGIFGFGNHFYECTFCYIGQALFLISIASIGVILYQDFKATFNKANA